MNKQTFKANKLQAAVFAAMSACAFSTVSHALEQLNDQALAEVTGKELAQFTTIKPGELGNPNGNVGFYRLGLDAKIAMNTNINKLRLGCDNANGTSCDVSIDKIAMTGFVAKQGGGGDWTGTLSSAPVQGPLNYPRYGTLEQKWKYTIGEEVLGGNTYAGVTESETTAADAGAGTDFVLNRPFVELAIQNPDSITNRKLVGYRFGAHEAWGIMSYGSSNPDQHNHDPSTHTGLNVVSGRFPQIIDNGAVEIRGVLAGLNTQLKSGIVAGNYNLNQVNAVRGGATNMSDFGRTNDDYDSNKYLRNIWLGDNDTTYTNYVGKPGEALQGRALEMKRSSVATIMGMIARARPHPTEFTGGLGALAGFLGDQKANQIMDLTTLHQMELGADINGNYKYDEGEGARHMAFQFQTIDGLQWQTTDNSYQVNGNNDWLSTRAGWWLEMPLSSIRDFYVPYASGIDVGTIHLNQAITLGDMDLGVRPVDNCYGSLTFC